ncbi:MAG: DUF4397 domain-containing protein [Polyangiales bacterium]
MTDLRTARRALVALPLVTLACGGSPPPTPRAVYTAEQLNAVAQPALPDDSLGAPMASAEAMPEAPPPPPPHATVRVIHAIPAAPAVALYVDDATEPAVASLAFRAASPAVEVPTGDRAFKARREGAAADAAPLLTMNVPATEADGRYTVIAYSTSASAGAPDASLSPETGHARVRFFHALQGVAAVDVCVAAVPARPAAAGRPATPATPAVPVFTNVAYGHFSSVTVNGEASPYASVPAGAEVTLQVRLHAARPCVGALRGTVRLTVPDQAVATAVATGRIAPRVAPELLVCPEGAGATECSTVPVR